MKKLLLVEDEEVILKALRRLLERNHYEVHTVKTVEEALQAQPQSFDLILADLRLPGAEGTTIIPAAEAVPVIIMTSHASVRSAVDAMRHGAIDYIAKPFDHDELLLVIKRALMQNLLQAQNQALKLDVQRCHPIPASLQLPTFHSYLNDSNTSCSHSSFLHIHGEPGTQREDLARAIHAGSERKDTPFVVADVSPATTDDDARALFGESIDSLPGKLPPGGLLQAAQNGTLALRHPEHLQRDIQKTLSEAFSRGIVTTPISGRQRAINVRIISISRTTINALQKDNLLAPELAELLINNQLEIPPLRQHPVDILHIANQQLKFLTHRSGRKHLKLSAEAESALRAYEWPGNTAELNHMLARAAFITRSGTISTEDLGFGSSSAEERDLSLDEYFRYFVLRNQSTLSETDLAARLGISRKALWERRQKMKLPKEVIDELSSSAKQT